MLFITACGLSVLFGDLLLAVFAAVIFVVRCISVSDGNELYNDIRVFGSAQNSITSHQFTVLKCVCY